MSPPAVAAASSREKPSDAGITPPAEVRTRSVTSAISVWPPGNGPAGKSETSPRGGDSRAARPSRSARNATGAPASTSQMRMLASAATEAAGVAGSEAGSGTSGSGSTTGAATLKPSFVFKSSGG